MGYYRDVIVDIMRSWLGKNEKDGSHKEIIDIYNDIKPRPRNYKLQYTDAWCAGTVSAAFHKAGYDAICPSECGCYNMVEKAKKMGIWVENDAYVPALGDIIMYDWQDSGAGDNTGCPDHVGIVEKVTDTLIQVIEGNYNDSVKRRTIKINGKNIRGFITPKYSVVNAEPTTTVKEEEKFRVVTALNMRKDATVNSQVVVILPKDTIVSYYGIYKMNGATPWYYVSATVNENVYEGYCSSKYLVKA